MKFSRLLLVTLGALALCAWLIRKNSPRPQPAPPAPANRATARLTHQRSEERLQAQSATQGELRVETADPTALHPYPVFPEMPPLTSWRDYNPDQVTVELEPGLPVTYVREKAYADHDRLVWIGRNPALPLSALVASGSATEYHAIVDLAPGSYAVNIRLGVAHVYFDASPTACGLEQPAAAAVFGGPSLSPVTAAASGATTNTITAAAAALTVDLSLFVDQATVDAFGYDSVVTRLTAEVAMCNVNLANSLITNFQWAIADIVTVPASLYVFHDDMAADLSKLSYPTTGGTLGELVKTTMAASGSDEAVLLVTGGGSYGGLAWVNGQYAMVLFSQIAYRTLAHEMGHNFGAIHDRITSDSESSDLASYNYGYEIAEHIVNSGGSSTYYTGDIMSYAGDKAPMFANPNVSWTYHDLGDGQTKTIALGVDVTGARPAYAARTLSESAAAMAARGTRHVQITQQPASLLNATGGGAASFTIAATAGSTYQWQRNGVDLAGAISSRLVLDQATSLDDGQYACVVQNSGTTLRSSAATLKVGSLATFNGAAKLIDIATRSAVGTGDAVQIAGFVLSGRGTSVLVRGAGPALVPLGVTTGYLPNPTLSLRSFREGVALANDDWDAALAPVARAVGAFGWTIGSRDAALAQTLPGGLYSAIIEGKAGVGIALVEVYDTNPDPAAASRLVNISTRSWVDTSDNAQIAGFVIGGSGPKTILLRASGPALADQGMAGTLPDPTMELHSATVLVATNDNWCDTNGPAITAAATAVGAAAWSQNSKDTALLVTLPPGAYSAIVTPKSGTSPGIGLVEIYEVK